MGRRMLTVGLLALVIVSMGSGCGEAGKAPTPKTKVSGTVQLDGKPMDEKEGVITFSMHGESPLNIPINAGKFEGEAFIGESKVEIRAFRMDPPIMMGGKPFGDPVRANYIPDRFNNLSTFKTTVPAAGAKDLKFDVESK